MAIILTSRADQSVPRIVSERAHAEEPGAVGSGPDADGGDPAALRRANPPGATARADESVAETV